MSISGLGGATANPFASPTIRAGDSGQATAVAKPPQPIVETQPSQGRPATDAAASPGAPALTKSESSAVAEFLRWANMTPAERIRAQYLEQEGLTEDSLKTLPEEMRERIEMEIQQRIRDALGGTDDATATSRQANQAYTAAITRAG